METSDAEEEDALAELELELLALRDGELSELENYDSDYEEQTAVDLGTFVDENDVFTQWLSHVEQCDYILKGEGGSATAMKGTRNRSITRNDEDDSRQESEGRLGIEGDVEVLQIKLADLKVETERKSHESRRRWQEIELFRERQAHAAEERRLMELEDEIATRTIQDNQRRLKQERRRMQTEDRRQRQILQEFSRVASERQRMVSEDNNEKQRRQKMACDVEEEKKAMAKADEASRIRIAEEFKIERRCERQRRMLLRAKLTKKPDEAMTMSISGPDVILRSVGASVRQDNFTQRHEIWRRQAPPAPKIVPGFHIRIMECRGQGISDLRAFGAQPHLETLDISDNNITVILAASLPKRLRRLMVARCGLKCVDGDISLGLLQYMNLTGNPLTIINIGVTPLLHTLLVDPIVTVKAEWVPRLRTSRQHHTNWAESALREHYARPISDSATISDCRNVYEGDRMCSLSALLVQWRMGSQRAVHLISEFWLRYRPSFRERIRQEASHCIQKCWRRYKARVQAASVIKRWWTAKNVLRKVRHIKLAALSKFDEDQDDIERLNDGFFDFIHDDVVSALRSVISLPPYTEPKCQPIQKQIVEFKASTKELSIASPVLMPDRLCSSSDILEDLPKLSLPPILSSLRPLSCNPTSEEIGCNSSISDIYDNDGFQPTSDDDKGEPGDIWQFSSDRTRMLFNKKARRHRLMHIAKQRRHASAMER